MAVLYIVEYSTLVMASQGVGQIPSEPPVAEQTVAVGASAVPSAALNAKTRFVRLMADVVCAVSFVGAAGTASGTGTAAGTGHRLAAGAAEYVGVDRLPAGSSVSVIATA